MNVLLSSTINLNTVLIVIAIVAVLAVVFGALIVLISKICFVKEDEKVKAVTENLAGANCGGCGYAGCADFAKALAQGKVKLGDCNATANSAKEEIAKILDIPYSSSVKSFAVVKCAGGTNCKDKFEYVGNSGCDAENSYLGGRKLCSEGCLGGGSCLLSCKENALYLKEGVAMVDKAICGACGACVRACPKNLVELIPENAKVYVACSTKCRGKEVMNTCTVGCIGCGLCAKNCPENAITMKDNLPVIDYSKCTGCLTCAVKCPKKTIKEI